MMKLFVDAIKLKEDVRFGENNNMLVEISDFINKELSNGGLIKRQSSYGELYNSAVLAAKINALLPKNIQICAEEEEPHTICRIRIKDVLAA